MAQLRVTTPDKLFFIVETTKDYVFGVQIISWERLHKPIDKLIGVSSSMTHAKKFARSYAYHEKLVLFKKEVVCQTKKRKTVAQL